MPRKASPNSSKYYFTDVTEQAIIDYNTSSDDSERNKIYEQHLKYAFNKLAENLIHRFKFYHFDIPYEDVKHETVAHLIEKINKFTAGKGKAFSYFSIVAKNYLINENNGNYYTAKNTDDLLVVDDTRQIANEISRANKLEDDKEFMDLFIDFIDSNMTQFTMDVMNKKNTKVTKVRLFETQTECLIADSILELFKTRENIEVFNKKALYILIKERSGEDKTQDITKILKRVEMLYKDIFVNWSKTGKLQTKYLSSNIFINKNGHSRGII